MVEPPCTTTAGAGIGEQRARRAGEVDAE